MHIAAIPTRRANAGNTLQKFFLPLFPKILKPSENQSVQHPKPIPVDTGP